MDAAKNPKPLTVVALDLSSKTGWAAFRDGQRVDSGTLFPTFTVADFGEYPASFVKFAEAYVTRIYNEVLSKHWPDVVVVEESNPGKQVYSQKLLEFLHYTLADRLLVSQVWGPKWELKYVRTGVWRSVVGAKQNDAERKLNARISREKQKRAKAIASDTSLTDEEKKKILRLPIKVDGKVVGKKTRKHVAFRVANEIFGLNLKKRQEDEAEAALIGWAFLHGAEVCDGTTSGGKRG